MFINHNGDSINEHFQTPSRTDNHAELPIPEFNMRVLICGGREFADPKRLTQVMDELNEHTPITLVISGCARGADTLGARWAMLANIPIERYPANWDLHGKSAGFKRNLQMLHQGKPELVVAFPGGKGTTHTINSAHNLGITVYIP